VATLLLLLLFSLLSGALPPRAGEEEAVDCGWDGLIVGADGADGADGGGVPRAAM
jgi:hypothetical protein